MSVRSFAHVRWQRRSLAGLIGLALLAPVFAWAAEQTGYAEPMDNAVELAGVASEAVPAGPSVFSGYALPGLGTYTGTLAGALVGTGLTLLLALAVGRLLTIEHER
jgi:cobalt/nickel transport protein